MSGNKRWRDLFLAGATVLPGAAAYSQAPAPPAATAQAESSTWELESKGNKYTLTRLPESPEKLIDRLFAQGNQVVFLPHADHRETSLYKAQTGLVGRGTALAVEFPKTEEISNALKEYKAGNQAPYKAILFNPRDANAPTDPNDRKEYFDAKWKMYTAPLGLGKPIHPIDSERDNKETNDEIATQNRLTAAKAAGNLYLNLNFKKASLEDLKTDEQLSNWAEIFAFGPLISQNEEGELAKILGKDVQTAKEFSAALNKMGQPEFGEFKGLLGKHLGRVTGKDEDFAKANEKNAREAIIKTLEEFGEENDRAIKVRDTMREAKMVNELVALVKAGGKSPQIIAVVGTGHTKNTPEIKGGRKDLDELLADRGVKATTVLFMPLSQKEFDDLPKTKDGTPAVFAVKGGFEDAYYVVPTRGEQISLRVTIQPNPNLAPDRAEIARVEAFQREQKGPNGR